MLKHVAKHHYKDQGETHDNKSEDDSFVKSKESNNQKEVDAVEEGFIFKETMLDDFL